MYLYVEARRQHPPILPQLQKRSPGCEHRRAEQVVGKAQGEKQDEAQAAQNHQAVETDRKFNHTAYRVDDVQQEDTPDEEAVGRAAARQHTGAVYDVRET